jgi:methionyl-tRNA formyltransferase
MQKSFRIIIATAYPQILSTLHHRLTLAGCNVAAVITRDSAQGVISYCEENQIEILRLPEANGTISVEEACRKDSNYSDAVDGIKKRAIALQPDFIIAWGINVLPQAFLNIPRELFLNVHPSDLPSYRGGFPFQAQLLNGEEKIRIVIHETTEIIDKGRIFKKSNWVEISENETMSSLVNKCLPEAGNLVVSFFSEYPECVRATSDFVVDKNAPHAWGKKLKLVNEGENSFYVNSGVLCNIRIEWHKDSVVNIERAVRAFDMMGGPFTNLGGTTFNIISFRIISRVPEDIIPGSVIAVKGDKIVINCVDGVGEAELRLNSKFSDSDTRVIRPGDLLQSSLLIEQYTGIKDTDRIIKVKNGITV